MKLCLNIFKEFFCSQWCRLVGDCYMFGDIIPVKMDAYLVWKWKYSVQKTQSASSKKWNENEETLDFLVCVSSAAVCKAALTSVVKARGIRGWSSWQKSDQRVIFKAGQRKEWFFKAGDLQGWHSTRKIAKKENTEWEIIKPAPGSFITERRGNWIHREAHVCKTNRWISSLFSSVIKLTNFGTHHAVTCYPQV